MLEGFILLLLLIYIYGTTGNLMVALFKIYGNKRGYLE